MRAQARFNKEIKMMTIPLLKQSKDVLSEANEELQ